ncbi:DUF4148 domain-containing protein [Xylophilus sp. GW821-FHT01B05]
MNSRTLVAASLLALAVGQSAFAQDAVAAAPVTRASVVAELQRARAAGELEVGEAYGVPAAQASRSALTRAEVVAQIAPARAAGELDPVRQYAYGYPTSPAAQPSDKTRAEVKAEVLAAVRAGTLPVVGDRS